MLRNTTPDRALAITTGGIILAALAIAIVLKSGGLLTAQAPITLASFAGVFAASFVLGRGSAPKRIAIPLMLAIVIGEITSLGLTAERQIAAREDVQAPLKAAAAERLKAAQRIEALRNSEPASARLTLAKTALSEAKAGGETQRVRIARETAEAAREAVDREAANISCKRECVRKQGVATQAEAELKAALAEAAGLQERRIVQAQAEVTAALAAAQAAQADALAQATAAYEAMPVPPSATPLADRAGIAPWILDLALAGGAALAAVVIAACLVAHGASPLESPVEAPALDQALVAYRTVLATPLPDCPDGRRTADIVRLPRPNGPDSPGPDRSKRPGPSGLSGPSGGLSKAAAFDDLMQRLADGRTIGSQDALASDWGRPKQTVSDWLREWRRAGVIPPPVQSGRCKATIAV
ncbi:MAG TPA: hypothetical protein PKD49_07620 [Hyphomicrobium sp.]|nr:hypothetical protein [Hyphomicrobium sp.]